MKDKTKKRLSWALEKLDAVALAAYGLLAGDKWVAVVTTGITIPEGAQLVGITVILVAVWIIIGYLNGLVEEL